MLPPSNNNLPSPAVAPALALVPNVAVLPSVAAAAVATTSRPPSQAGDVGLPDLNQNKAAAVEELPATTIISVTMTPPSSSTTTTTTAIPTATAATAASASSPMDKPTECRLLGPFAIVVQLALGALALLSLVYKRWRERPQRPVRIWFFDVSKQVFGSVLVHAANVFMSMLTSGRFSMRAVDPVPGVVARRALVAAAAGAAMLVGRGSGEGGGDAGTGTGQEGGGEYVPNPCSYYLLNLGIDTTIGIPVLIIIVRLLTRLVSYTPLGKPAESIQSGNYGDPPKVWWWLKQSIIYFCGLMGMKLFVLILFIVLPWLPHVGDWALGWTEGNEELQIFFVMMLFPLIMNALQYYIIDSYIKKQEALADRNAGAGAGETVAYEELLASDSDDSDDEVDEGARKGSNSPRGSQLRLERRDSPPTGRASRGLEYDPNVDGDSQTVIGSSSSHISTQETLPKELLPAE